MGQQRLRAAVAGVGFIGAVHARAARLAGARLVGVAASTPARAEAARRALDAERAFPSARALAVADEVDVVHVCTPNHLHRELALAALAAGKHVVCEKPLATTAADAGALAAAAARAGRQVAAVPFVYRYYAMAREARERVRSGATGPLHLLHGVYLQDWLLRPDDRDWRLDPARGGRSRAFADIGAHWCDLAEFVSGHRIVRLTARTRAAIPRRGDGPAATEDVALVQFETDRGALGAVVVSQVAAGRKNRLRLELDGAREALAFDQEAPEALWCGRREAATLLRRDPAALSPPAARFAWLPPGHPQGYADCVDRFVGDVYAAVRDGAPPDGMPTFADGLRAVHLTEAVLDSAAQLRWVDVAPASDAPA